MDPDKKHTHVYTSRTLSTPGLAAAVFVRSGKRRVLKSGVTFFGRKTCLADWTPQQKPNEKLPVRKYGWKPTHLVRSSKVLVIYLRIV